MTFPVSMVVALAAVGLAAGLGLLVRGLRAQRTASRISGIGTSAIGMLAAGEVRISGEAVPAGVVLTSRLRLRPAVYYRAVVTSSGGRSQSTLLDEQRSVGFFVRDGSGEIRVFQRSARWDVPLDAETPTAAGGEWAGGASGLLAPDPGRDPLHPARSEAADFAMPTLMLSANGTGGGQVRYREARIGPGDTVTVVGRAIPFQDLADPTEADGGDAGPVTLTGDVDRNFVPDPGALEDPEVAASYAHALREGIVLRDPEHAWGNAAIEGFGIGHPVRPPHLDPGLAADGSPQPPPDADPGSTGVAHDGLAAGLPAALSGIARPAIEGGSPDPPGVAPGRPRVPTGVVRDFEIPPDRLVIAAGPDVSLLIAVGSPSQAFGRSDAQFLLGLLGGALSVVAALVLALALSGALGSFGS